MRRTCVAVVDATRARLFTFERSVDGAGIRESFAEHTDLVNPARRRTAAQLFSDTRTNTNRANGRHYGTDDHRNAHIAAIDAEFAWEISAAIEHALRESGATRLVLCASPRMLGTLRATDLARDGLEVDELARDYVKLTPPQIRDMLAAQGLLPLAQRRVG